MPQPMATSHGSATLAPASSSTNQVSHYEGSAARCRSFQERKRKQSRDAKLTKARTHSEVIQVRHIVNFKFSALSSLSHDSTPETNITRQTAQTTPRQTARTTSVHIRNSVSYFNYLQRKLKFISSKVDSYNQELDRMISVMRRKIDSYTEKLNDRVDTMRFDRATGEELGKGVFKLNAKKDAFKEDLNRRMALLNAKKASCNHEIRRQTQVLDSRLAPFAQELDVQRKLLDVKTASYTQSLREKIRIMRSFYDSFFIIFSDKFTCSHI